MCDLGAVCDAAFTTHDPARGASELIVIDVAFLSVWRLWRPSGFLTAPTWRRVGSALWLLLPAIPMVFGAGVVGQLWWKIAIIALGVATVAVGEEAVFRDVVLRVLTAGYGLWPPRRRTGLIGELDCPILRRR